MSVLGWIRGKFSPKHLANWRYRRGLIRAKTGHTAAAMQDYCDVISASEVEPNLRAMARYNRALLHWSAGDEESAIGDLNQVLEESGVSEQVKTEARRKLLRISRTTERAEQSEAQQ